MFLAPGGELVAQPQPAFAENSTAQIHAAARVVQQAAQAPTPLDLTCIVEVASLWADELVRQALMISFGMTLNPVLTTHRAPSDAPGDLAGRVGRLISLGIDTVTATEIVATPNLHQSPP